MATDVRQAATSTAKHDAFIEAQLARAEKRIRALDLTTALLGFAAGTLAYAVAMALLDRQFVLSGAARQAALLLYLLGSAGYLGLTAVRPLCRRINPYYAARRLEQTLPGSKNSVVNWVDLRNEKLPAVIRGAVGQRAARDLGRADLEQAISGRRAGWAGGVTGLLAVVFVGLFLAVGPRPFGSLMRRAFAPLGGGGGIATRTWVRVVRPQGGDVTVSIGSPLTIVAEVDGRLPDAKAPDAPHLLFWREDGEEPRKRYLQPEESGREWATTISSQDVGSGFRYRVSAGDFTTDGYLVKVRAAPLIADFLATYRYRPYVAKADKVRAARKLEDLRGTEVVLLARTNRLVKEGKLHLEAADGSLDLITAEKVADDPEALRFRLVLDKPGKYRIRFTSLEDENYLDPVPHEVVVLPDLPPQVRLTKPGRDITLPANGLLKLQGEASDDIGVAGLTLQLQVAGGPTLEAKPYRGGSDKLRQPTPEDKLLNALFGASGQLRLPNGGHPRRVDYRDFVDLAGVKSADGKPFALEPGMGVEYWLEARDGCDFHQPNVTPSKHYRVKIEGAPRSGKKREQERRQAEKEQKEHEANQDRQFEQEDKARQVERKEDQAQARQEAAKHEKGGKKGPDGGGKKPGEEPKEGEKKDGAGDKNQERKDQETQKKADALKDAMEKRKQEKGGEKGKGKDKKQQPGQSKDGGERKPGSEGPGGQAGKKPEAENKGPGGQGAKDPAGQGKEGKGGKPGQSGAAKPEGKKADGQRQGAGKEGGPKPSQPNANRPGQPKGKGPEGKPESGKAGRGAGQPGGSAGGQKGAGAAKPGGGTPEGQAQRGKGREAGAGGKPADGQPQGGKKEGPTPSGKSEAKGPGSGAAGGGEKSTAKGGKPGSGSPGAGEPAPGKGGGGSAGAGKGDRRPPRPPGPQPEKAKKGDVEKEERPSPAEAAAKGAGSEETPPTDDPGRRTAGGKPRPGTGAPAGTPIPARPDTPEASRAGTLQLEEFRKGVDPDVLKDAKMSPEEFKKFLRDYADLVKRKPAASPRTEKLPPASRGGALPTGTGRRDQPRDTDRGDLRNEGRAKPPPGYGDPYKDFLNRLAQPEK